MSFPGDLSLPGRVLGQRRLGQSKTPTVSFAKHTRSRLEDKLICLACILRVAELLYASILDQVVCTKR